MRNILKDKMFHASLALFVVAVFVFLASNSFLTRADTALTGPPCAPPLNCGIILPGTGGGGSGSANSLLGVLDYVDPADATKKGSDASLYDSTQKGNVKIGNVEIDTAKGNACIGAMIAEDTTTDDPVTTTPFKGAIGGYKGAATKCGGSRHICTVEEVIRTINCNSTHPIFSDSNAYPAFQNSGMNIAWISKGSSGYLGAPSNDCYGWTAEDVDTKQGAVWIFTADGGYSSLGNCTDAYPILCCK